MGPMFSCPALPGADLALEKKQGILQKKNVKIKKVDLFLHILPDSNQNLTENTAINIEISTEYLHTKWRQRQTFERHYLTTRQKTHAMFS